MRTTIPAALKFAWVGFVALRTRPRLGGGGSGLIIADNRHGVLFLVKLCNPHLRLGRADRHQANGGGGVFVEHKRRYAGVLQQITQQVGVGKVLGGIDAFHGFMLHAIGDARNGGEKKPLVLPPAVF